jgi:hypothetical protein
VWLTSVILAVWEAEIRRIKVQSQQKQKVLEFPSQPIKIWAWWYVLLIPALWKK